MDAKKQFSAEDHAKVYRSYRRDTPASIIEKIISCLKEKYDGPLDVAVDVGCGSGQSTVSLAPFFSRVHGIDVSEAQIQEAKTNLAVPNVTYENAPAEVIPFADESVQLVSAGASLHWFHLDSFFPEVRRALCDKGVLAVYCYYSFRPVLDDHPELMEEVDKIWKEFYALTSDYHAPQAKIAWELYESINFPFEEVMRVGNLRDVFDGELEDITGYMSTFSGFQNMKREDENKAAEFLSYAKKRFREIIVKAKLNPDEKLKLYRDFYLIICRKLVSNS